MRLLHRKPHRLFPVSGLMRYISLIDEEGNEQMIIRNVTKNKLIAQPQAKEKGEGRGKNVHNHNEQHFGKHCKIQFVMSRLSHFSTS